MTMKREWSRLSLRGEFVADSPIRVGGLDPDEVALDAQGRPFIPASTFRGALRAHTESMLRGMDSDAMTTIRQVEITGTQGARVPMMRRVGLCCDSVEKPHNSLGYQGCLTEAIVKLWEGDPLVQPTLDETIYACTCLSCRVFGAPWLASRLVVADLPVIEKTWNGLYDARGGAAISRETGISLDGRQYARRALPAGTRFSFSLVVENASLAQQGLVLLGLRAFELGWVPLGAERARGLGRCHLEIDFWESRYTSGDTLIQTLLMKEALPFSEADAEQRISAFADMLTGLSRRDPPP
jgi:CRISPR/Cas system CSM-associated protein Csm3 (group 7 of RAMP superfamily)